MREHTRTNAATSEAGDAEKIITNRTKVERSILGYAIRHHNP